MWYLFAFHLHFRTHQQSRDSCVNKMHVVAEMPQKLENNPLVLFELVVL